MLSISLVFITLYIVTYMKKKCKYYFSGGCGSTALIIMTAKQSSALQGGGCVTLQKAANRSFSETLHKQAPSPLHFERAGCPRKGG